jgi:hypothetical protein
MDKAILVCVVDYTGVELFSSARMMLFQKPLVHYVTDDEYSAQVNKSTD